MEVIKLVGVIRQSKYKGDQAVSEESQRQAVISCVDAKNRQMASSGRRFEIVGWAIDIGVSADKYDPWKRPQLGAWLKRPESYDGFIAMKLDRLARNTLDFAKFMRFCDDYNKVFLCSDDPIDLTTDMGRAMAVILSVLAELELKAIKTRNKNARKVLNESGRWPGGHVPYGRKAVQTPEGWKLVRDPDVLPHIGRLLDLIYEGKSRSGTATILNEEGIPTPHDVAATRRGEEGKQRLWTGGVIEKLLRSRHLIGQREIDGTVLRDENDDPVIYCEPLMSVSEWNRLQKSLDKTSGTKLQARRGTSLARKVGGCLDCESNLQSANPGSNEDQERRRYRCSTVSSRASGRINVPACGNPSIKMSVFDEHLENAILDMVGHLPRMEKEFMPGEDHAEELERVDDSISSLREESDRGLIRNREEYFSRLERLQARRDNLLALPQRPAGWHYKPTGETIAEYWNSMDKEARNLWLQEMGVRLFYSLKDGAPKWRMVLGDLEKLPLLAQGIDEEEAGPVGES